MTQAETINQQELLRRPASDTRTMRALIEAKRPEIEALAMAGITAERLARVTMLAISKSPDLQRCTAMSVLSAMMEASKLGLDCSGGTMAQGYLVPMKDQAVFMPGYRGLRELVMRSGMYDDIYAEVVYAADHFEVSLGTDPKIVHVPNIFCGRKDDDIIGAYSVAVIRGGRKHIDFIDLAYIKKVQNFSRMGKSGAWRDWFPEQVRKTAMRHGCKGLSMSAEVRGAFEIDDQINDGQSYVQPKSRPAYEPMGPRGAEIDTALPDDWTVETTVAAATSPVTHKAKGTPPATGDTSADAPADTPAPALRRPEATPPAAAEDEIAETALVSGEADTRTDFPAGRPSLSNHSPSTGAGPASPAPALGVPPKNRDELRSRFEAIFVGREVPWKELADYESLAKQGAANTFRPQVAFEFLECVRAREVQS